MSFSSTSPRHVYVICKQPIIWTKSRVYLLFFRCNSAVDQMLNLHSIKHPVIGLCARHVLGIQNSKGLTSRIQRAQDKVDCRLVEWMTRPTELTTPAINNTRSFRMCLDTWSLFELNSDFYYLDLEAYSDTIGLDLLHCTACSLQEHFHSTTLH